MQSTFSPEPKTLSPPKFLVQLPKNFLYPTKIIFLFNRQKVSRIENVPLSIYFLFSQSRLTAFDAIRTHTFLYSPLTLTTPPCFSKNISCTKTSSISFRTRLVIRDLYFSIIFYSFLSPSSPHFHHNSQAWFSAYCRTPA